VPSHRTGDGPGASSIFRYKGKCSNCGKFGHKPVEIFSKMVSIEEEECREAKKMKKGKNTELKYKQYQVI